MVDGEVERASVRELEELYRARYRRYLRLALAVAGSRDAAADAVQEGFARALRSRHELRDAGSLDAWVWRMVMNAAIDQRRRAKFESAAELPEAAASDDRDQAAELRAAIAELPERQRHALFLRHYADLSYDEIADVLGVARGTIAATLHAAHASLRAKLPEVAA